jgi:RHS repeat-associated protein
LRPRAASQIYYQVDGSQNVASVTGSTGALVTNYTYQPWGQAKASVAGVVNRYQFASEAVDPQTGFIYVNGRYYRPVWGRFFSQGTLGGSPNDYLYQGSNPIR